MKIENGTIPRAKAAAVALLYLGAASIAAAGAALAIVWAVNGVSFQVMSSRVPGALFGAVIAFLGVRYLLAVGRLKQRVFCESAHFSWDNFKQSGECGSRIN